MEEQATKIDRYLLGQMSDAESKTFEEAIEKDEQLAKVIDQQRSAIQLLELQRDSEMKARLQNIHQEFIEQPSKVVPLKSSRWKTLGIAAAAVLLFLVASRFLFPNASSPQQLYATHHQSYELSFASRGQVENQVLELAGEMYQVENYEAALPQFSALTLPKDASIKALGQGLCLLELDRPAEALPFFQQLFDDPLYAEPAQWYAALSQLKLGNINECKILLIRIPPTTEFHQEALALLKDLE